MHSPVYCKPLYSILYCIVVARLSDIPHGSLLLVFIPTLYHSCLVLPIGYSRSNGISLLRLDYETLAWSLLNHLQQGKLAALLWRHSLKPMERHMAKNWSLPATIWVSLEVDHPAFNKCSLTQPQECNIIRDPEPKPPT